MKSHQEESRPDRVNTGGKPGNDTQLACTEITLLKELSLRELVGHAMMYMVNHPLREWEMNMQCCSVRKDKAEAWSEGSMAIAEARIPKSRERPAASWD